MSLELVPLPESRASADPIHTRSRAAGLLYSANLTSYPAVTFLSPLRTRQKSAHKVVSFREHAQPKYQG